MNFKQRCMKILNTREEYKPYKLTIADKIKLKIESNKRLKRLSDYRDED